MGRTTHIQGVSGFISRADDVLREADGTLADMAGFEDAHAELFASQDRWATTSPRPVKTCAHYGEDAVFTAGEREFYGARGHNANPNLYDVVLDLAGAVDKPFLLTASERFRPLASPVDFLRLQWPDQKAPPVAPQWWLKFAETMPVKARILIACIGSHGRTGTALALFAMAYKIVSTAEESIAFVRKHHCKHAIETKAQREYLSTFENYLKITKKIIDNPE
jgi:hypothetical protein